MPDQQNHDLKLLAFDIGAESGRAILGELTDDVIRLEEVHRFANGPVRVGEHLHTDVLNIWNQIQFALKKSFLVHPTLASVGVDTWGVDYSLLDKNGGLLQNPFHYRDHRTSGIFDKLFSIIPHDHIYLQTGNQLMEFNTLCQLYASRLHEAHILQNAASLLMLPDLFHFWLCGEKSSEYCIATTTQCFDQTADRWAESILKKLDLPVNIFQNISPPGTFLGNVHAWLLPEKPQAPLPVILPSGHDTGCAVTAIPVETDNFLYISSGTWSLVGTELSKPLISKSSQELNFTNEGNPCGRTRFLKMVPGMWLLQQFKKECLDAGREYSYDQLIQMALQTPECGPAIDITAREFLDPGAMSIRIQDYCRRSDQTVPQSEGEIVRCILESMAYLYRSLLEGFENILEKQLDVVHIVGGGSRNNLLNQLTANITHREVISGPVEATAAGNVLIQAMGLGYLSSLSEIRNVVKRSFSLQRHSPCRSDMWEQGYQTFRVMLTRSGSDLLGRNRES